MPCFSHQAVSVKSGACDDLRVPASFFFTYLILLLFPCAAGQLSLPLNWTASVQAAFVMQFYTFSQEPNGTVSETPLEAEPHYRNCVLRNQ